MIGSGMLWSGGICDDDDGCCRGCLGGGVLGDRSLRGDVETGTGGSMMIGLGIGALAIVGAGGVGGRSGVGGGPSTTELISSGIVTSCVCTGGAGGSGAGLSSKLVATSQ